MKRFVCFMLLTAMFTIHFTSTYSAAIGTDVFVNGVEMPTDTQPIIRGGVTYVPFRAIAEMLGCSVNYDGVTRTVKMDGGGIVLEMTVDSKSATVNGKAVEMNAPPIILNNRTMVPVRFVSETFKSTVKWLQGYDEPYGYSNNVVKIYSELPVIVKPLGVGVSSKCFTFHTDLGEENSVSYDLTLPQFSGLKNTGFQAKLNSDMMEQYRLSDNSARQNLREQESEAPEYGYHTYSDDQEYRILGIHKNILTVMLEGYLYFGGAHGMPYREVLNIDTANNKILQLADIFTNPNYKQVLLRELNALRPVESTFEDEISEVLDLPSDNSFYFQGGSLVIFYPPYDLASYARGFVEFKIPLTKLSGILKAEIR